jgi:hypothetical protein
MSEFSKITLDGGNDCIEAVQRLMPLAEEQVAIFSQALEPLLYDQIELCDRLSALARKNKRSQIRIIAQSTRNAVANGHCLVRLAQRLSSYVQIRIPSTPELQRFEQSWLIIDDHSICQIANPQRWEGYVIEHDRLHVRKQLELFNQAWESSQPDVHSRRLEI